MEIKQELILKFMLAMAGTKYAMDEMDRDPDMAATMIYLRAEKLADEYLSSL